MQSQKDLRLSNGIRSVLEASPATAAEIARQTGQPLRSVSERLRHWCEAGDAVGRIQALDAAGAFVIVYRALTPVETAARMTERNAASDGSNVASFVENANGGKDGSDEIDENATDEVADAA